jgi:methionyl-tRNA formyltransferase
MRLIMMGTGPFAVPTFESLLSSEHQVLVLVTRPTADVQTRGKMRPAANPMREAARTRGVLMMAAEDINAAGSRLELASFQPDLLVVCDYGQILSAETLGIARLGGINLHGSLLPKYRGAAPVNWAIWNGEKETGVTVLHMTPRLDAGPCLAQVRTGIGPDETAAELEARLARMGVEAVHRSVAQLAAWDGRSALGVPQANALATRARRLKKSDGSVDWRRAASEIYCQFRAVQPWPGLYTVWRPAAGGEPVRIKLEKIRVIEPMESGAPGQVLRRDGELLVAAGQDAIAIQRLQPAGRRPMDAADFLRGNPVRVGDMLGRSECE